MNWMKPDETLGLARLSQDFFRVPKSQCHDTMTRWHDQTQNQARSRWGSIAHTPAGLDLRSSAKQRKRWEMWKIIIFLNSLEKCPLHLKSLDFIRLQQPSGSWNPKNQDQCRHSAEQHFLQRRSAPWQDLKAWQTVTVTANTRSSCWLRVCSNLSSQLDLRVVNNSRPRSRFHDVTNDSTSGGEFYPSQIYVLRCAASK